MKTIYRIYGYSQRYSTRAAATSAAKKKAKAAKKPTARFCTQKQQIRTKQEVERARNRKSRRKGHGRQRARQKSVWIHVNCYAPPPKRSKRGRK